MIRGSNGGIKWSYESSYKMVLKLHVAVNTHYRQGARGGGGGGVGQGDMGC